VTELRKSIVIELRKYQTEAVEAAWQCLRRGGYPIIELPTGSGKSLVCAELCRRVVEGGGRVIVATHVQELVQANAAEFETLTGIEPGVLCAGLERDDKNHAALFASVQSLYKPIQRGEVPPPNLLLIDEAHLCADPDSDAKFYPTFFKAFPEAQRVGLSATPSRMSVPVYGEGKWFTEKCYEVSVLDLVRAGFLAPLVGVSTEHKLAIEKLSHTAGEFDAKSVEKQETKEWLTRVANITKELTEGRKHIAIFAPTVAVAEQVAKCFTEVGLRSEFVVADTEDRGGLVEAWKAGEFPAMASVSTLHTGFNFPTLDVIVCLRPTESQELWRQMLGRGTRKAPGKKNCLVIDFSSNLEIHGGICAGIEEAYAAKSDGSLAPVDVKPKPRKVIKKPKQGERITDLDPMIATSQGLWLDVIDVSYVVIGSRTQPGKRLLMINYTAQTDGGIQISASEFCCCEYSGYAFNEAVKWFEKRGEASVPRSAEAARIKAFGLPTPRRIRVRKSGKYMNVLGEEF